MITFLFWNLNKRPLATLVAQLVHEQNIDIVILAECEDSPDEMVRMLKAQQKGDFCSPYSESRKIIILTRFAEQTLQPLFDDAAGRLSIRRLQVGSVTDVLLAAVHFHSKVNWSDHDQTVAATDLARDVAAEESRQGHQRTILVGDFNMNPFDPGMVAAGGLHGMMTRQIAERRGRVVAARNHPFFYNPMWGLFGDRTPGPCGTHYYPGSQPVTYFWNIFDQVLLRPDLMNLLQALRVVDMIGKQSLLTSRGEPDKAIGSDHLPLMFRLNLPT